LLLVLLGKRKYPVNMFSYGFTKLIIVVPPKKLIILLNPEVDKMFFSHFLVLTSSKYNVGITNKLIKGPSKITLI
jgi:hypothetical protein